MSDNKRGEGGQGMKPLILFHLPLQLHQILEKDTENVRLKPTGIDFLIVTRPKQVNVIALMIKSGALVTLEVETHEK